MEWDEASRFPSELIPKLGEMGLLGVIFPEEYGGAGLGYVEYVTVIEELARVDGSVGLIVAAHHSLCTNHIYKFGNEDQRKKYVIPLAQGKKLGCWSLTEPEAGSDAGGTRTIAARKDGGWILNGAKTFTTNGHYADVCVAMAVTDKAKGSKGISAFILEKGTPGFRLGKKENKLGMTQGAYEAAVKYAKQRKQFGKAISEFQAIQFKLADMATEIEAARLLVYHAAWLADRKSPRFTKESSMAKLYASAVGVRVASEAVQIFGGYGFIKDYPVEKFYRDSKLCTIGEGTSEIQRMIIARQILDKD